jgi:hypothetical protein
MKYFNMFELAHEKFLFLTKEQKVAYLLPCLNNWWIENTSRCNLGNERL